VSLGQIYNLGTVTVTNGSATVTSSGAIFVDVLLGDTLQVGTTQAYVSSVNAGFNVITLMAPWAGATATNSVYMILKNSWSRYDPAITQAVLRDFLSKMADAGIIYAVDGTVPDPGIGNDGDYALKTNVPAWTLWLKVTGTWVVQGDVRPAPPDPALFVHKAGGVDAVMTGLLTLSGDPTAPLHAVTKQWATPLDAMAYNGMQYNGSFEVSQQYGHGSSQITPGYAIDGWSHGRVGSMTTGLGAYDDTHVPGLQYTLVFHTTVAQTTLGGGDYAFMAQQIEGYRIARLGWGTASARPITIAFWSVHQRAGGYTLKVGNATSDRSYCAAYVQAVAGVPQYNVITIPGCTTGTWNKTNGVGILFGFTLASGTIYTAPVANTWYNANYIAAPGQVNGVETTADGIYLFGVFVFPGTQAPAAAQAPLIMRPFDQELLICQRYFRYETFSPGGLWLFSIDNSAGYRRATYHFNPYMRIAPVVTITATVGGSTFVSGPSASLSTPYSCQLSADITTVGGYAYVDSLLASARL
jgi:hypothetical protein